MRLSFDVSLGLTTPDGIWFGFRIRRETNTLVADRNADVALEKPKTGGGPLTQSKRPSNWPIYTSGEEAAG